MARLVDLERSAATGDVGLRRLPAMVGQGQNRSNERTLIPAIVGGALWIAYGIFEFLKPLGEGTGPYRPDLGYELVADPLRYVIYGAAGGFALVLTALALVRHSPRVGGLVRIGRVLAYVAGALGALALVGVISQVVPLFFGSLVAGSLLLGLATFVVGLATIGDRAATAQARLLISTGVVGILTLPLRPLVYAVTVVPHVGGALVIALFGLGWIGLGLIARHGRRSSTSERPVDAG